MAWWYTRCWNQKERYFPTEMSKTQNCFVKVSNLSQHFVAWHHSAGDSSYTAVVPAVDACSNILRVQMIQQAMRAGEFNRAELLRRRVERPRLSDMAEDFGVLAAELERCFWRDGHDAHARPSCARSCAPIWKRPSPRTAGRN